MFSHLKAEDFVNFVEGAELSAKYLQHLDTCSRCRQTWLSVSSVHAEIVTLETDTPEPDWSEFRSSVRDELLSRSIQRQSVVRRWTGWSVRPAVAWALSLVLTVGITTVTVLWRTSDQTPTPVVTITEPAASEPTEFIVAEPERSLFDDVVSLGEEEQERFRELLESAEVETRQQ